jgi:hypothetical protein
MTTETQEERKIASLHPELWSAAANGIGREGMLTVWDDQGGYVGCLGIETWEALVDVKPQEFVSARDASRGLGKLIDRLEAGEIEKAVIVDRNKPRAVLYSFSTIEANQRRDA